MSSSNCCKTVSENHDIRRPGCRDNKHPVQCADDHTASEGGRVKDNHVIIHCLDNSAYYSRKEEGGDILLSAATSTMNCHEFPVDLRSGLGQHGAPILHV
jgi:hypothetical protein